MMNEKWLSAIGNPGRIIAAKISEQVDLVEGIIGIAKEYGVVSGNVTAIGSLSAATVVWAKSKNTSRSLEETMNSYAMKGPVELGMGWGVFGTDENGQTHMHFHALVMDKDGKMRCGNLKPGSAPVMATVDLSITEFKGFMVKPTYHPVRKNVRLIPTNCI